MQNFLPHHFLLKQSFIHPENIPHLHIFSQIEGTETQKPGM